jgi:phosphoadenosine phosphosulfate reductase
MADDLASASPASLSRDDIAALNTRAHKWTPQQILAFALTRFAPATRPPAASEPAARFVIASSFSAEDNVVVDVAARISRRFRVVTLDTGRLPEETYAVQDAVRAQYGVRIDAFFPQRDQVEELVRIKGAHSFRASVSDRKECCAIRKLEPLARALSGVDAWATGLRAAQSVTRTEVQPFELDDNGRVKVNPLWRFTDDDLWKYVKEHGVPVSALYAQGYTSIGCAPCTRAVQPGETDPRAGRWWWESPEHKECGLHASHPALAGANGGTRV